jgi:hypothetical protein
LIRSPSSPSLRPSSPFTGPAPTHLAMVLSVAGSLACLVLPADGVGQEPIPGATLPREVRDQAIEFLNAPATLRFPGGSRIPQGTAVEGDVGVLGGSLQISGRIRGDLLVANGDLRMEEGSSVEGNVLVLGGRVAGAELARIDGDLQVFQASLRYRIRDDRVEAEEVDGVEVPRFLERQVGPARARFTLRAAGNYNRVEGLPVSFGPLVEVGGRNPFLLEAFGIWRSVDGLDLARKNLGYGVRVEQGMAGSGELFLGLSAHSRVLPVENRGLDDTEASLATFLLRRDFLDYVERSGWSASLEMRPVDRPVRFQLVYREEDHEGVAARDPWTIRDPERGWRPLAAMAEGPLRTLEVGASLDTRDDLREPAMGWWIQTRVRRAVGGDLQLPTLHDPAGAGTARFLTATDPFPLALDGTLDIRRYNRLGPSSRLQFRLLAAGSLDGHPLPPQHQIALGGEGSLPGHPRFSLDCGARRSSFLRGDEEVFPFYGCDRVLLAQMEYHGLLPFSRSVGRPGAGDWEWDALLDLRPEWTLFVNGGRGWTREGSAALLPSEDSRFRADVGAGIHVGSVGLYWAYPLNRRDRGLNFFVRLQHRF